ncbi:hypothetical protein COO91_04818 [Nostoc flagelliforme CCNUN1]|uniref:Uncharacterized protein n=1 Tax=Nostoc flagelliforme CCNUN1 TaxID=2038116 RepID=A0A2K8STS5_9NOSO|nr:hypothetical protein COO91_04818 [Nostoc flagelliforme CCNUN1]
MGFFGFNKQSSGHDMSSYYHALIYVLQTQNIFIMACIITQFCKSIS